MEQDLESLIDEESVKSAISATLDCVLNKKDKAREDTQLLICIGNYVRTQGKVIDAKDLKAKFAPHIVKNIAKVYYEKNFREKVNKIHYLSLNYISMCAASIGAVVFLPTKTGFALAALFTTTAAILLYKLEKKSADIENEFNAYKSKLKDAYDRTKPETLEKVFSQSIQNYAEQLKKEKYI